MGTVTDPSQARSMLYAPDCCFIDLEISSCTKSFFSWGGSEEKVEEILQYKKKSRREDPQNQRRKGIYEDHPPPVIALSHSTVSNSSSSASSLDNSTEERRQGLSRIVWGNRDRISRRDAFRKGSPHHEPSPSLILARYNRDFASLHEMLINSLFEDAQARHAFKMGTIVNTSPVSSPKNSVDTVRELGSVTPKTTFVRKPASVTRKTSTASVASRNSTQSKSSQHSEILTPSSHRFKPTLTNKRRKVYVLPIWCRRIRKKSKNKKSSNVSVATSRSSGASSAPTPAPDDSVSPTPEELSSCASSNYTSSASSFLHTDCRLQKDKGKGVAPGNAIVAFGRYDAMNKLGEKIDLLVEMEREGNWSNAALTRVPSRIMARDPKKLESSNIVETRSMIGVKMGFLSIRYGLLIHWNIDSGQAELILLRKMCNDNFLKDSYATKDKQSKIWKRNEFVRKMGKNDRLNAAKGTGAPSFVTLNSNELLYGTEDEKSFGPRSKAVKAGG